MSPVRIVAHPVADGTVSLTDAPTACLATRYTARTARMVEQPIGVRTPTAIKAITAIANTNCRCLRPICGVVRGLSRPSRCLIRFTFLDLHARHEVGNDESAFVSFGIN